MAEFQTRPVYQGGYVADLFLVTEGRFRGWLCYRHPDGQLVTLADMHEHADVLRGSDAHDSDERTQEEGESLMSYWEREYRRVIAERDADAEA